MLLNMIHELFSDYIAMSQSEKNIGDSQIFLYNFDLQTETQEPSHSYQSPWRRFLSYHKTWMVTKINIKIYCKKCIMGNTKCDLKMFWIN